MNDKIKCSMCGKEFEPGNGPDGIPNGLGFVKEDGTVITMCADCIIKMGIAKSARHDS